MGKEQSKLSTTLTASAAVGTVSGEITPKNLLRVQKTIIKEYPFLESVYESMLLTDCSLPDCPIVFANEQFEKLTLYPKEEIVGRNCRFLQGPHTNPNTVKAIRAAVDNGQPLDVELLNYRKDGVPFMNCFLMLPIHKNANPKNKVTHFLAIQKDVTLLRPWEQNPADWSPSEVSMWLDKWGFTDVARMLLKANITGSDLLKMTSDDLLGHGIIKNSVRKRLIEKISAARANPSLAYAGKLVTDSTYKAPTYGDGVDTLSVRGWWRTTPKKTTKENNIFPEDDDSEDDDDSTFTATTFRTESEDTSDNEDEKSIKDVKKKAKKNKASSRKKVTVPSPLKAVATSSSSSSDVAEPEPVDEPEEEQDEEQEIVKEDTLTVKVYNDDNVFLETLASDVSFTKLKKFIQDRVQSYCRFSYYNALGEVHQLKHEDWKKVVESNENHVLRIIAKSKTHKMSKGDARLLSSLGSALLVTNSKGHVVHYNKCCRSVLGDLEGRRALSTILPDLDLNLVPFSCWTPMKARQVDGHQVAVIASVSEAKDYLKLILIAPQI